MPDFDSFRHLFFHDWLDRSKVANGSNIWAFSGVETVSLVWSDDDALISGIGRLV